MSRLRWISTKLALVLGAAAGATVALSLLAVWAFQPLIPVLGNRFRGGWFDAQGIVPAAYMLFALALGSCMGAVWRRTIAQTKWPAPLGPGDWILRQSPTGVPTSGPPTKGAPASIYHYIPAGRFWTLQSIEAAIFLVLTAALIAVCVAVVVRSRPH